VYNKGGVTPFHDQKDSQILHLLTKCFAQREFQIHDLNELLSLLEKKLDMNHALNYEFCNWLKRLHRNGYLDDEKPLKDVLIEQMGKIDIVCDKNKGISIFN
jgi:Cdc6-like AAA superfamily ATPase